MIELDWSELARKRNPIGRTESELENRNETKSLARNSAKNGIIIIIVATSARCQWEQSEFDFHLRPKHNNETAPSRIEDLTN